MIAIQIQQEDINAIKKKETQREKLKGLVKRP
jgi:hypothetical protein